MVSISHFLRLPRPRKFLGFIPLRPATELITVTLLFNKATGIYGLLAIFTGYHLDATQASMYVYSVLALVLAAILMPHIRKQSPLQNLALAWFYLLDTVVNSIYTAAFAVTWFLTVSATHGDTTGNVSAPGSGTIDETAGFTSPEYNVSEVKIVASPRPGIQGGETAVAIGVAATAAADAASSTATAAAGDIAATIANPSVGHGLKLAESVPSIFLIVLLTLIRVYFVLILMAYARQALRGFIQSQSNASTRGGAPDTEDGRLPNPFATNAPLGSGWRGSLGRIMVRIGRDYWLGTSAGSGLQDEEDWARNLRGRFERGGTGTGIKREANWNAERERRARKGTGPPRPSGEVVAAASAANAAAAGGSKTQSGSGTA